MLGIMTFHLPQWFIESEAVETQDPTSSRQVPHHMNAFQTLGSKLEAFHNKNKKMEIYLSGGKETKM